MRCLKLLAPAMFLALTAACAVGHRTAPSPLGPPAVPADWPTLRDAAYGFSLRYPAGWTQKFDQPAGFHALASRADMSSLLDLQSRDYWLVAQAAARDASVGCGEPDGAGVGRTATTLDGQPATRYSITGTRGDTTQHIIDVISVHGSTRFSLQLVTGSSIPPDRALSVLEEVQASYRFGAA
jgi:hypothetical protein